MGLVGRGHPTTPQSNLALLHTIGIHAVRGMRRPEGWLPYREVITIHDMYPLAHLRSPRDSYNKIAPKTKTNACGPNG